MRDREREEKGTLVSRSRPRVKRSERIITAKHLTSILRGCDSPWINLKITTGFSNITMATDETAPHGNEIATAWKNYRIQHVEIVWLRDVVTPFFFSCYRLQYLNTWNIRSWVTNQYHRVSLLYSTTQVKHFVKQKQIQIWLLIIKMINVGIIKTPVSPLQIKASHTVHVAFLLVGLSSVTHGCRIHPWCNMLPNWWHFANG